MWVWISSFLLVYLSCYYICDELTPYLTLEIQIFFRKNHTIPHCFLKIIKYGIFVAKISTYALPGQILEKIAHFWPIKTPRKYRQNIAIYCIILKYRQNIAIYSIILKYRVNIVCIEKKNGIAHGCSIPGRFFPPLVAVMVLIQMIMIPIISMLLFWREDYVPEASGTDYAGAVIWVNCFGLHRKRSSSKQCKIIIKDKL